MEEKILVAEERAEEGAEAIALPFTIGDTVWDFALPDLEGSTVRIGDYRGKVVVLFFFTTWCPYCVAEAPYIEKELWQRFKDRGVQILAVDVKESRELADRMRKRFNWTFPVLLDDSGTVAERFAPRKEGLSPEVAIINAHFILDRDQRIRSYDYLNMEKFDARARHVIRFLEQLGGR